jgi:hypothetical protein
VQNGFPTFATIFRAIRLRGTILLHLTENIPGVLSKTSPENDQPRIAQNGFSGFSTMFYIFCVFIKPLHNGLRMTNAMRPHQSIKVRSPKWRRRTLNK